MLIGEPTEGALLALAAKAGIANARDTVTREHETPFQSATKWMSVRCQQSREFVDLEGSGSVHYIKGAMEKVVPLKGFVDTFFDKVMVMAEDKALRENRVRLLMEIAALFGNVADFSKLQAET